MRAAPATSWTARAWLTALGYRQQAAKITGPLQELAEQAAQALEAGLGRHVSDGLLTDRMPARLFRWRQVARRKGGSAYAKAPDPGRARIGKTGWRTYHAWAYRPYAAARAQVAGPNARTRHI